MKWPVALPRVKVRFSMVSRGVAWSWQWLVVQVWRLSQVFMYRIRRFPAPLSVTLPPPFSTTCRLVFTTLAVAVMVIVTGLGPQLKLMIPPLATARTTAREVQLAAVPRPITRVGWAVLTARPASGT